MSKIILALSFEILKLFIFITTHAGGSPVCKSIDLNDSLSTPAITLKPAPTSVLNPGRWYIPESLRHVLNLSITAYHFIAELWESFRDDVGSSLSRCKQSPKSGLAMA
jgi:hypothetical protein